MKIYLWLILATQLPLYLWAEEGLTAKEVLKIQQGGETEVSPAKTVNASPLFSVQLDDGIEFIDAKKHFKMNLKFRFQNRMDFVHFENSDDDNLNFDWYSRRLRLKMDGHVYSPDLTYKIELAFTRRDQDWADTGFANIILDAMIRYQVNKQWQLGFGQGKLPGNRQRVISSGDLQFVDRSLVNSVFNLDRDFGLQLHYETNLGPSLFRWENSITSGEGRNQSVEYDHRLFYVTRFEWLPLGRFKRGGDYFESDLAYETSPKLSLGTSLAYLDGAARANGADGEIFVSDPTIADSPIAREAQSVLLTDALFKYLGHSLYVEWAYKDAANPVINAEQAILTGHGMTIQAGKMLTPAVELALRYTAIFPDSEVQGIHEDIKQYLVGMNYFLNEHKVKLQANLGYQEDVKTFGLLQIELGI